MFYDWMSPYVLQVHKLRCMAIVCPFDFVWYDGRSVTILICTHSVESLKMYFKSLNDKNLCNT